MALKFNCPACKKELKVEVVYEAIVSYTIDEETLEENYFETKEQLYDETTDIIRFQCIDCGFIIKDKNNDIIVDEEEFYNYIKDNKNDCFSRNVS